jgi:arsenical pump membrane protein
MSPAASYSVLGLTVYLAIKRPKIGKVRLHHAQAGIIGASLVVVLGIVSMQQLKMAMELLSLPVITIVSLMTIVLVAEQAGLFDVITRMIAKTAGGDPKKLFTLLFFSGTLTGTLFTNDAAILIFTPLVFSLVEEVQTDWQGSNKLPFYFGVLYVANLVGALVIANPINIVVARIIGIDFISYACWMMAPAVLSMIASYIGLRLFFRKSFPTSCKIPVRTEARVESRAFLRVCAVVLVLTLIGFFTQGITGIPVWAVASAGALISLVARGLLAGEKSLKPIVKGIGWDVLVFLVGIFIVVLGARNAGLAENVRKLLAWFGGGNFYQLTFATGFVAAFSSALFDNHPTANIMSWVIRDFNLPHLQTKFLAFAALIGGDLGPRMSPIGSLAALMWLRLLRDRGVNIPYRYFLRINVPVTLVTVLLSIIVLSIEIAIFATLP